MMMKILSVLLMWVSLVLSEAAMAEIYKRVDENGRIVYSNIKTSGATRLDISPEVDHVKNERPKVAQPSVAKISTPENFPKIDKQTQIERDDKRKEILLSELEAEKLALTQAQEAYTEGESKPEVYRKQNADGSTSTFRNMAKYNAKMDALRAEVESHQNNIQMLQKEINALH